VSIEPDPSRGYQVRAAERLRTPDQVLAEARPFDWEAWQTLGDDLSAEEADAFCAAIAEA
jgi:hypothetical protein